MRITWSITKKRGNLRPVLSYSITLEDHEQALALPPVSILSSIPKPEEDWQEHCYPGQFERNTQGLATPLHRHFLESPSHKGHSWTHTLRLPWREDNEYPEVAASFQMLRETLERELASAHASRPMQMQDSIGTSKTGKREIASGVLAERFLRIAENGGPAGERKKTG